jgi:hypothetical protein
MNKKLGSHPLLLSLQTNLFKTTLVFWKGEEDRKKKREEGRKE